MRKGDEIERLSPVLMLHDCTSISKKNAGISTFVVRVANGAEFVALELSKKATREASGILYLHVQRLSRKCYIGVTEMRAHARWNGGIAYRHNRRFAVGIAKHGWDAFDSFVLAFADDRGALARAEVQAIAAAGGHKSRFTYNLSPGGDLVAENDKPLVGVFLENGEEREFKSGAAAARELGFTNVDKAMAVARGERQSAGGWWFRFKDSSAKPPVQWGDNLRVARVREKQAKRVVAIHYETIEQRVFDTTKAAAVALGIAQSQVSMIARGDGQSAKGWWFKFEGDNRELPALKGSAATRAKRDKEVHAVGLVTGERRSFRNCRVADRELGLHIGAAAGVVSGARTSAGDWWFSYDRNARAPVEFKGALVAKARSKAVVATNLATGKDCHFESAKLAAAELGVSRAAISKAIKGALKVTKGYSFRFA